MFTGIIETTGEVLRSETDSGNVVLSIRSAISGQLEINQSVAHDGACFSIGGVENGVHRVTVIAESLARTTAGDWKPGDRVNLERALPANGRLEGHIVLGHVDTVAVCVEKSDANGSTLFRFSHPRHSDFLTVKKGSVCVNGISLTVVDAGPDFFSVAIIPFTLQHTSLQSLKAAGRVNVEFDLLGKYLRRIAGSRQ